MKNRKLNHLLILLTVQLIFAVPSVNAEYILEILFPEEIPELVRVPLRLNGTGKKALVNLIEFTELPTNKNTALKLDSKEIGKKVEVHSCTLNNQIATVEVSAHQTLVDQWIDYKFAEKTIKAPLFIEQDLPHLKIDLVVGKWETLGSTLYDKNGHPMLWRVRLVKM
jgi:hypothetical protein